MIAGPTGPTGGLSGAGITGHGAYWGSASTISDAALTGPVQFNKVNFTGANVLLNGTAIGTLGSITGGSSYTPGTIIQTLGSLVGGSGYVQGFYLNVPLTGGAGSNATANIGVTAAGVVSNVTLTAGGSGYLLNDVLSASNANLGGSGSGLTITVTQVGYNSVSLTGGTGSGATANISVSAAGAVTVVTLTKRGTGYAVNDTLSAATSDIGGTGSGFSVPVTVVGSPASIANNYLSIGSDLNGGAASSGTVVGSGLIGPPTLNLFWLTDTVDCFTAATQGLVGYVFSLVAQGAAKGNRQTMQVLQVANGPTGNFQYTALNETCETSKNLGGTAGVKGGSIFANNPLVWAQSGATWLREVIGEEIDIAISTGASAEHKLGLQIVQTSVDAVRGSTLDAAIVMGAQAANPVAPWTNGLVFGHNSAAWPFDVNSTLMATMLRSTGPTGPNNGIAGIGIDFSAATFGTGPILLPGGPRILSGSGSPAGVVNAPIGTLYLRIDGATGTTLYVKEAGTGNTGWTAK